MLDRLGNQRQFSSRGNLADSALGLVLLDICSDAYSTCMPDLGCVHVNVTSDPMRSSLRDASMQCAGLSAKIQLESRSVIWRTD